MLIFHLSPQATMDKLNQALMSACRLDQFSLICRLHMLELLELRSLDWRSNAILDNYYRQKLAQIEGDTKPQQSQTAPVLSTVANPFALQAISRYGDGKEITNTPELQSVLREEKDNKNPAGDPSALSGEIQQEEKKFSITVKIQLLGDRLRVVILNCRHLKPLGHLQRSQSGEFVNQVGQGFFLW